MTSPEARATEVIDHVGDEPSNVIAAALATEGLLAPELRIIRTRDELAALDPDTLLFPAYQFANGWESCNQKSAFRAVAAYRLDLTFHGPAVVIATGDQVRAARRALGEADREPATDDFHSSIGLWQPRPPATWKEA